MGGCIYRFSHESVASGNIRADCVDLAICRVAVENSPVKQIFNRILSLYGEFVLMVVDFYIDDLWTFFQTFLN